MKKPILYILDLQTHVWISFFQRIHELLKNVIFEPSLRTFCCDKQQLSSVAFERLLRSRFFTIFIFENNLATQAALKGKIISNLNNLKQ